MKERALAITATIIFASILTGCVSVYKLKTFSPVGGGSINRQATLLIPAYVLCPVEVDGELVCRWRGDFTFTAAHVVEMLPGPHEIRVWWFAKSVEFYGSFNAEPGKNYALFADWSSSVISLQQTLITLRSVYVAEIPVGTTNRLTVIDRAIVSLNQCERLQSVCTKRVADLQKVKGTTK
jgi:hypothetical protein